MEDSATEGTIDRRTVSHKRTIVITLAVGFVYGSQFLLNLSYVATIYNMTRNYLVWSEQRKLQQLSYVVTGVIAYGIFAVLFQKLRRKTCLYLVCASQLTACVVLLFANAFWLLHIYRVFAAISCVGAGMMCVIYVSEIAPDDIRGGLVAIHKLLFGLTEVVPIVAYVRGVEIRPLPLVFVSISISMAVAICTYIGIPESPIYFLRLDDTAGAKRALKSLRGDETYVSQEIANRKHILKVTRSDYQTTTSVYQDCTKRRTVMFICVAVLLYLTRIFAGLWVRRYEVDAIYWILPSYDRYNYAHYTLGNMAVIILGGVLVVVLCDHVGRKILLLLSTCVCLMSSIASGIVFHVLEDNEDLEHTRHVLYSLISIVSLFSFYMGINSLPEVIITDIFPPKILNTQIAILGSLHLCVDFLIHFVIYYPFNNTFLHWLCVGLTFIACIFIFKFLPETKRRPPGFLLVDNEQSVLFSNLREESEE